MEGRRVSYDTINNVWQAKGCKTYTIGHEALHHILGDIYRCFYTISHYGYLTGIGIFWNNKNHLYGHAMRRMPLHRHWQKR